MQQAPRLRVNTAMRSALTYFYCHARFVCYVGNLPTGPPNPTYFLLLQQEVAPYHRSLRSTRNTIQPSQTARYSRSFWRPLPLAHYLLLESLPSMYEKVKVDLRGVAGEYSSLSFIYFFSSGLSQNSLAWCCMLARTGTSYFRAQ